MELIYSKAKLSDVALNPNLRTDYRYLDYTQSKLKFESQSFSNFIIFIANGKDISPNQYVDFNESDTIYPTVNNFKGGQFIYDSITFLKENIEISMLLENDDIIISRSGTVGLTYVWNPQKINTIFGREMIAIPSGYLIVVKIDKSKLLPEFVKHLFNSYSFQKYFFVFGVGKTQKNIAQPDILSIPIPIITVEEQKDILSKIKPLETKITNLENTKEKTITIINQILGEELGFDWIEFEQLKSHTQFNATLKDFANNIDCRISYKFHNKAGQFVYDFLYSTSNKRIKDFLSEPIVLGKSVSPSDYEEEGEFYYIAMSNIKNWAFDPEDCKKVSESYSSANLNKTVKKGDILLARSGEGTIGKVALIDDEDIQAIFADFTQRIRLKNYNLRLAYYYFQSDLFQYLVYTHKKGLGNNTNIFPSQIQEFPIPDWTEEKQAEIVEKIRDQIDAQNSIDKEIEKNMAEIKLIIEAAIKID